MPKPYDATSKFLAEFHPEDWLSFLGMPEYPVEILDADFSTVTTAADKILKVNDPAGPYCIHFDYQSAYDAFLDLRTLSYTVFAELKLLLPVVSIVVALSPRVMSGRVTGGVRRSHPLTQIDYRYTLIKVWDTPAEQFMNAGIALMPFAPLGKIDVSELPGLIYRMRVIIDAEQDAVKASKFWTAVSIFMGLKFEPEFIETLLKGVANMRESTTYQAILREGEVIGKLEGKLEGKLDMFKIYAESCLGDINEIAEVKLNSIKKAETVDMLVRRLKEVKNWTELLEGLEIESAPN